MLFYSDIFLKSRNIVKYLACFTLANSESSLYAIFIFRLIIINLKIIIIYLGILLTNRLFMTYTIGKVIDEYKQ